jgi:ABC-type lipoprotein export system ATPase subunit
LAPPILQESQACQATGLVRYRRYGARTGAESERASYRAIATAWTRYGLPGEHPKTRYHQTVTFSRFYLCDLQVHTPADARQGYGDVGGRDPNEPFARRLVQAHADRGVRVLAVSDHNRVDWYPVLREVGEEIGVYIFPALEFSVNRCHLLAVWDRTDQGYRLAQEFLTTLWKPGEDRFASNGDPRPVGQGQVMELAHRATGDYKALVLAPHSTAKDIGMFASGVCTNRADVIASGNIAGYDVWGNRSADILKNPATDFGQLVPTWFISGDVRKFEDVGTRATFLKVGSEPTLEGLRQAFLMPETRVRLPSGLESQWGHVANVRFIDASAPSWARLGSVKIEGGFHDGLDVEFGPGLNAVIGGKGTGKSTLIEILRYVLDAGAPQTNEAKGNREHNFKANAEATVRFIDGTGDEYEVRRSGGKDAARLSRQGKDVAVDVGRRVSVRVFGQRELQALVEHPEVLREFVATEAGPEWLQALSNEKAQLAKLSDLDTELQSLEGQVARLEDQEHELVDLTDRIDNANARGVSGLMERLGILGEADSKIKAALAWPESVGTAVDVLAGVLPEPEVPEAPTERAEIVAALDTLGNAVTRSVEDVRKHVDEAHTALAHAAAAWTTQHSDERARIERELADAGLTDPRELGKIQARALELQGHLTGLPQKRQRADAIGTDRTAALRKLGDIRRQKSRLVEAAAHELNSRVGRRVRIRVDPLADKTTLVGALEKPLKSQSVRSDQLRRLAETQTPTAIASAVSEGQAKVETLGCTAATASKLCALAPHVVRAIEETDTPDRILVEVNLAAPGGEEVWHDVTEVSPGQRATALLALALAGGREPLIIDQPEDDLDNQYIYDEVVKVLARVCESRQVIVATHNANIPILGDAELVLALDAQSHQGTVLACGGLEDPDVAQWARKILEGGAAAFQARHRRYQAATR